MTSEFALIDRIRAVLPGPPAGETWIGDDAAVVAPPAGLLLLAADAVVAGVHADLAVVGLEDMGWKALAAAVSDMAAMGGRPRHAVVTVAGPPETDVMLLYEGLAEAAAALACPVVGGDLVNAPCLVVSVAVQGEVDGAPVLRSGGRPGDRLFVTAPLGASALGLRLLRSAALDAGDTPDAQDAHDGARRAHRRPVPDVAGGQAARAGGATAMVDVSDGLVADLDHLAVSSGAGVALEEIPVAPGATLDDALYGGEDYVLAFSAPDPAALAAAFDAAGRPRPVEIGRLTAEPAERTLSGRPLVRGGWAHQWR
jgi:thiamine-monophosphate kinase